MPMTKLGRTLLTCSVCGAEYEDAPRAWCGEPCDHCDGILVEHISMFRRPPVGLAHDTREEARGER